MITQPCAENTIEKTRIATDLVKEYEKELDGSEQTKDEAPKRM